MAPFLMNLLQKHRDRSTPPHYPDFHASTGVEAAASLLGLKEFDFFRLAYRRWFRAQPHPKILENAFSGYMFSNRVPVWVRHLVREVLDQQVKGSLKPEYFGAAAYRDRYAKHPRGPLYAGLVVALSIAFMAIIVETSRQQAQLAQHSRAVQASSCPAVAALPGVAMWANMLGDQRHECALAHQQQRYELHQ